MSGKRRYDIDWIRIAATIAVFLFHCARFFDTEVWHLKNTEQSEILFILTRSLIWPWLMEIFFLLAGFSSWHFLEYSSAMIYLWSRVKRLLVPLYTVGLFLLLPIQNYFELKTKINYQGSFWSSVPRYFSGFGLPELTSAPDSLFAFPFSGHLWFLYYLFLISLISLPLLLHFKSKQGKLLIHRLAMWSEMPGGILIFVIPLLMIRVGFRWLFGPQRSWADFLWYWIFFLIGYIISADVRFSNAIKRSGWVCLILWLGSFFGGIGYLVLVWGYDPLPGIETISLAYVLYQGVWSLSSWSAVVFLLSIGIKYWNKDFKPLSWCREAVLPFYLLHQTVILCVGYFVIRWKLGILPKMLAIGGISFPSILLIYKLLVRPYKPIRILFGVRKSRRLSIETERTI